MTGTAHEDLCTCVTSDRIPFRMRSVSKEICRESQIKHCDFSHFFSKKLNDMEKHGRPQTAHR